MPQKHVARRRSDLLIHSGSDNPLAVYTNSFDKREVEMRRQIRGAANVVVVSVPQRRLKVSVVRDGQKRPAAHNHHQQTRSLAVYAVGEGWTGALGTGRLDETIRGHFDEEDLSELPKLVHDDNDNDGITSISLGWGHTAMVRNQQLWVTGRPHDFSALLRLRRLPRWIRDYAVHQTLQSARDPYNAATGGGGLDPTSMVGRFVSWLVDSLNLKANDVDWDLARQLSILPSFTEIKLPNDEIPKEVVCSAGFTCVLTERGRLYSFGLNGFGQCGIGRSSNNVWTPDIVAGLTSEFAVRPRAEMDQSHPIQSVRLGLQHALCLNTEGEIFAWGKGERG